MRGHANSRALLQLRRERARLTIAPRACAAARQFRAVWSCGPSANVRGHELLISRENHTAPAAR